MSNRCPVCRRRNCTTNHRVARLARRHRRASTACSKPVYTPLGYHSLGAIAPSTPASSRIVADGSFYERRDPVATDAPQAVAK